MIATKLSPQVKQLGEKFSSDKKLIKSVQKPSTQHRTEREPSFSQTVNSLWSPRPQSTERAPILAASSAQLPKTNKQYVSQDQNAILSKNKEAPHTSSHQSYALNSSKPPVNSVQPSISQPKESQALFPQLASSLWSEHNTTTIKQTPAHSSTLKQTPITKTEKPNASLAQRQAAFVKTLTSDIPQETITIDVKKVSFHPMSLRSSNASNESGKAEHKRKPEESLIDTSNLKKRKF